MKGIGQWADRTLGVGMGNEPQSELQAEGIAGSPAAIAANPPDIGFADLGGAGWEDEKIATLREASSESADGMTPNPPAWVTNEAAWDRAKEAVRPYWGNYSEPWAVVAHVYNNMTGG